MGEVCMVPESLECCLGQRMVLLKVDPVVADNRYLLYTLMSRKVQHQISWSDGTGTTVSNLRIPHLENLDIPYIPLSEQRTIAAALSCLDEKIELNNEINANLDAQAQAIFKSWFVNFEPFHDGEFVDSEFGPIPKNWRIEKLKSVTSQITTRVKDNIFPVLSAVKEGELVLSEEYFTKQVFSKSIDKYIIVGEKQFAYNPSRVNIGSLGMNKLNGLGCVSPIYVVFSVEDEYHFFFDIFFKSDLFKQYSELLSSGSVRQSMKYSDFSTIDIVYPPKAVIKGFNKIYISMLSKINKNNHQSRTLATLRDTLLPKLMSGEIEVPTAETTLS